jgi:hypothetical protein|tara:strand:- start:825 stop:1112 length:288 start_codon:yes stop_codon:yes gene_type:complete
MKNETKNTATQPTDLERMHYTDENGRKRIATIKPVRVKTMLQGTPDSFKVLTYEQYTRDGVPMYAGGIIDVEMIAKRVPLVRNLFYETLEVSRTN